MERLESNGHGRSSRISNKGYSKEGSIEMKDSQSPGGSSLMDLLGDDPSYTPENMKHSASEGGFLKKSAGKEANDEKSRPIEKKSFAKLIGDSFDQKKQEDKPSEGVKTSPPRSADDFLDFLDLGGKTPAKPSTANSNDDFLDLFTPPPKKDGEDVPKEKDGAPIDNNSTPKSSKDAAEAPKDENANEEEEEDIYKPVEMKPSDPPKKTELPPQIAMKTQESFDPFAKAEGRASEIFGAAQMQPEKVEKEEPSILDSLPSVEDFNGFKANPLLSVPPPLFASTKAALILSGFCAKTFVSSPK